MRPRLPLPVRISSRSYATRLPQRPPARTRDPLTDRKTAQEQPWHALPDANATFIHRPPPSAPTPLSYTTAPASPLLKPPTPTLTSSSSASSASTTPELPPTLRADKHADQARLSDDAVARIRELRRADPQTWTRGRLAREFGCAPWFVGRITSLKAADRRVATAARDEEHAAHRAKWGERRTMNAEIRKKRREFW